MSQTMMKTVFHTDLSDAHAGEEYWLHALGKRYDLVPHTAESRARAKALSPELAKVPDAELTHYTKSAVDMPTDLAVRVHFKHSMKTFTGAKAKTGVGHVAMHVPSAEAAQGAHATEATAAQVRVSYTATAEALIFHHPDLITNEADLCRIIFGYMNNNQQIRDMINDLALKMRDMGPAGQPGGWATYDPFTPSANPKIYGCDGETSYNQVVPTSTIMDYAGNVMTAMMIATKNDMRLQGKKWTLQLGTAVQPAAPAPSPSAAADAAVTGWNAQIANVNSVDGLQCALQVTNADTQQVQLTFYNSYLRYLAGYVTFLDANANAMSLPDWQPDLELADKAIYDVVVAAGGVVQDDQTRYLSYISPAACIMAIPTGVPGQVSVGITFPDGAVSAQIWGSGLGTGCNPKGETIVIGVVLTTLINLMVPTILLVGAAAATSFKALYGIVDESMKMSGLAKAVLAFSSGYYAFEIVGNVWNSSINWYYLCGLINVLFSPAAALILGWVGAKLIECEIVDEIPFVGWALLAMNIATDAAQIAETVVECASSPWNIQNNISVVITTNVTVYPDPRSGRFPQGSESDLPQLVVKMMYQTQNRPTEVATQNIDLNSKATSLSVSFPGNTLGGQVKFEADYYLGDWLAAKATTGWLLNNTDNAANVTMYLVENPVPLTDQSIYQPAALLTYENYHYVWQATSTAPTATVSATNTSSTGNAISVWSGLMLSQRYAMLGAAWKAAGTNLTSCVSGQGGQLYAMQNVDIPGVPMDSVLFTSCGLDSSTMLVYDPYPPKFEMDPATGNWVIGPDGQPVPDPSDVPLGEYWVDPRKAGNDPNVDGGYHLRKVTLSPATAFDMSADQLSYGRFPYSPDSMVLHPSGHAIGVNTRYGKIMVTPLAMNGLPDAQVPMARMYAGQAVLKDRPGLLFNPVAVTCSYDGTVLILEDLKASTGGSDVVVARIQAFDMNGNPVNRFQDPSGAPSSFLYLSSSANETYLDIVAVGDEKMTYMWVLYYDGNGASASDYHMAIYQYGITAPTQNPLVITDKVAAAKLAVDMWYTAYTLNYDMVRDANGNVAGPQGRTVPSITEWLPPVPDN